MAGDTYGSSVLARCGLVNVFGAEADRYPVVSLEEVAMLGPQVAVLPSEPYPFAERHLAEVRSELPGVATVLGSNRYVGWLLGLALVVFAGWVVYRYLVWTRTYFVLTDKRVISRSGIVSREGTEIPLERINNIDFHQRLFERVIGAGDLDIQSAGRDGSSHFENVRHPDAVQQEIYRQMETNAKRPAGWSAPPGTVAAPAPPDVTEQIRKLAELRDQGHITPAEYEAKKADLLERM